MKKEIVTFNKDVNSSEVLIFEDEDRGSPEVMKALKCVAFAKELADVLPSWVIHLVHTMVLDRKKGKYVETPVDMAEYFYTTLTDDEVENIGDTFAVNHLADMDGKDLCDMLDKAIKALQSDKK